MSLLIILAFFRGILPGHSSRMSGLSEVLMHRLVGTRAVVYMSRNLSWKRFGFPKFIMVSSVEFYNRQFPLPFCCILTRVHSKSWTSRVLRTWSAAAKLDLSSDIWPCPCRPYSYWFKLQQIWPCPCWPYWHSSGASFWGILPGCFQHHPWQVPCCRTWSPGESHGLG